MEIHNGYCYTYILCIIMDFFGYMIHQKAQAHRSKVCEREGEVSSMNGMSHIVSLRHPPAIL